jgi:hypothetical protein
LTRPNGGADQTGRGRSATLADSITPSSSANGSKTKSRSGRSLQTTGASDARAPAGLDPRTLYPTPQSLHFSLYSTSSSHHPTAHQGQRRRVIAGHRLYRATLPLESRRSMAFIIFIYYFYCLVLVVSHNEQSLVLIPGYWWVAERQHTVQIVCIYRYPWLGIAWTSCFSGIGGHRHGVLRDTCTTSFLFQLLQASIVFEVVDLELYSGQGKKEEEQKAANVTSTGIMMERGRVWRWYV